MRNLREWTSPVGCRIEPITDPVAVIDWVLGGAAVPGLAAEWLLCHGDKGVTWGRFSAQSSRWVTSDAHFPAVSPRITATALQQLRLFGSEAEVLIWGRLGAGARAMEGRVVRDGPETRRDHPEQAPIDDVAVLVGDRLLDLPSGGFSLVGDATGSRHAPPCVLEPSDFARRGASSWHPLRLDTRHYVQVNSDTGQLRIGLTRLLRVRKEQP